MNKQAIVSSVKELVRLVVLACVGALVAWLTNLQASFDPASVNALVIGLVLKFADRYAYKAKDVNLFKF